MKKIILISIAKEKKIKDFRLVITPSGRNRIGGIQTKDYGIISYPDKKDFEKIGELIYQAFNESDDKVIERSSNTKIEIPKTNEVVEVPTEVITKNNTNL